MSSSSTIDTLNFLTEQISLYFGLFIAITGIFGQIFNIIIFTTLKTFRETTCGFYLTIVSIANLFQCAPILISVITLWNNNLYASGILCKFHFFLLQYFGMVSLTGMCLTTIDQFLSMTRYRNWNNMRLAIRCIIFIWIFWFIHGIVTFIYYDSNKITCIMTNHIFAKYYTYFYLLILRGILPVIIISIFSLLAFFKIRSTANRQMNIIRLSRDRQLTAMTLLHVSFIVISTLPFVIVYAYALNLNTTDALLNARNGLIIGVTSLLSFEGYAVSLFLSLI